MADDELIKIPERVVATAHIKGMHNYLTTWEQSVDSVDAFWGQQARERLTWFAPPQTVTRGSLAGGDVAWFPDGVLNVSVNCLDRHPRACGRCAQPPPLAPPRPATCDGAARTRHVLRAPSSPRGTPNRTQRPVPVRLRLAAHAHAVYLAAVAQPIASPSSGRVMSRRTSSTSPTARRSARRASWRTPSRRSAHARATASACTCRWCPRPPTACSRARASAPSTPSSLLASRQRRCAHASSTPSAS